MMNKIAKNKTSFTSGRVVKDETLFVVGNGFVGNISQSELKPKSSKETSKYDSMARLVQNITKPKFNSTARTASSNIETVQDSLITKDLSAYDQIAIPDVDINVINDMRMELELRAEF